MHRHLRPTTLIATAFLATAVPIWNRLPAQTLASGDCVGFVRSHDGAPLPEAEVIAFAAGPFHGVVGAAEVHRPVRVETRTDAEGRFRLSLTAPASLLVRADGLGMLHAAAQPGDALRLVAQPLAEVRLPDDATGAWVRTALGDGEVALGFLAGPIVHLPAGRHRLLVRTGTALAETTLRLGAGERHVVFLPERAPWRARLEGIGAGARVVVDGWDEVPTPAEAGTVALWPVAAGAAARSVEVWLPGPLGALTRQRLVVARDGAEFALSPIEWRTLPLPAGAEVVTLARDADHALRLTAWTAVGPSGRGAVPAATGMAHVLRRADGGIVALGDLAASVPVRTVACLVEADGRPLAGALVELSGPPPQVLRRARTDARGIVRFAGAPRAAASLRLVPDEWRSDDVDVAPDADDGILRLRALPGARLRGRVTLPADAGIALGTVEVTLRDPTGSDELGTRRTGVAGDGSFAIGGLDRERRYTLFASAQRDGVTYSAKLHGVLAENEVLLELRSEDPRPPGRRR